MASTSKYSESLESVEREKYSLKIKDFAMDPYLLKYDENVLPNNISVVEIYEYLVHSKSFYSKTEFKDYKSLNAYKLYEGGLIKFMAGHKLPNGFLVFGEVLQSESLNLPPLKLWIQVEENGDVVTGHCNCVAGLDEVCSHICAVLFALNSVCKLWSGNEESVTDVKAYSMVPSSKKSLHLESSNIKYKRVDTAYSQTETTSTQRLQLPPKSQTIAMLKRIVAKGNTPVAVLSLNEFAAKKEDFESDKL